MSSPLSYTYWFRRVFYPAYNRLIGRDIFGALAERMESQFFSREKLREMQLTKLRRVLTDAAERVPFYREKFQEIGFDPKELTSLEQFGRLPFFVTKEQVRENTEAFIAEGCDRRRLTWHRSGGSTGTPLLFATDPLTNAASAAALIRCLRWWGTDIGARHAQLWGSPRFIIRTPMDKLRKYTLGLRNRLMNRLFIANYDLNDANMPRYRRRIERFRPEYGRGMASSLFLFARFLMENGLELERGRPKVVLSACEHLFDWERETIERGFRAPVADTYGVSEFADWGFEAPCRRLHLADEDVLTELTPLADGSGQFEVICTQLNNAMSPLIRYRTGDVADAITHDCECGRGLSVLEGLKGRAHDFIVAPDGKFIHGQFFTHLLVYEEGITRYQVVQEEPTRFRVILVTNEKYSRRTEERVRSGAAGYLGPEARLEFEYVEDIPLTPAGKHRWIVSKVAARAISPPGEQEDGPAE